MPTSPYRRPGEKTPLETILNLADQPAIDDTLSRPSRQLRQLMTLNLSYEFKMYSG